MNWFLNGFAVTFAIPSILILVSWNALPGERLYGVKTGLENVALGVTMRTPLASILSVKYTERRFDEANQLLSKNGSTLGYKLLIQEANKSSNIILEKKDKTQAKELIRKIDEYKNQIGQKKVAIKKGYISVPVAYNPEQTTQIITETRIIYTNIPAPTINPITGQTPPPTPVAVIPVQAQDEDEVITDLQTTEDDLDDIRDRLEDLPDRAQEHVRRPDLIAPDEMPRQEEQPDLQTPTTETTPPQPDSTPLPTPEETATPTP